MKLDVSLAIRSPGIEFPFQAVQAIAPQDVGGEQVVFDDAEVSGTLIALENGDIRMAGEMHSTAHARCANCLKPAEAAIACHFDELFVLNGDELDCEQFSYSSGRVDLEQLITSCALLELPMRMLCRPDCQDRPEGSGIQADAASINGLDRAQTQRPFAALQQLLEEQNDHPADAGL